MLLSESKHNESSFANLLNYGAMVDEGIMLLKDGAFLSSWYYEGQDLNSASTNELAALSAHINQTLSRLGNGWLLNVDAIRKGSTEYPKQSSFPSPVTALIDLERKEQYLAEVKHFETIYTLTLTYKPPKEVESKVSGLFIEGKNSASSWTLILEGYLKQTNDIEAQLSSQLKLKRMSSEELLRFLHFTITGNSHPIRMPKIPMYMDALLASEQFVGGFSPKIGQTHIAPIAVMGFPAQSHPELLAFLDSLPIEYRWSNRFIFLDPHTADNELKKYRKHWFQNRHGLNSFIKESFNLPGQTFLDADALAMADDANDAVALASSNTVRFGYYTCLIILHSHNQTELMSSTQLVIKHLQHNGFPARVEEINAVESYLGSLPGHGYPNVRRPLIHTLNLADLLPLTSVWPGLDTNPSPLFPENSPPLFFSATTGSTPFRFNLHVSDVGHAMIIGPTGSGKSTLLGLIMAQFFRYPRAQVFCFDKGFF